MSSVRNHFSKSLKNCFQVKIVIATSNPVDLVERIIDNSCVPFIFFTFYDCNPQQYAIIFLNQNLIKQIVHTSRLCNNNFIYAITLKNWWKQVKVNARKKFWYQLGRSLSKRFFYTVNALINRPFIPVIWSTRPPRITAGSGHYYHIWVF